MDALTLSILANVITAPGVFLLGRLYSRRLEPKIARRFHVLRSIMPFDFSSPVPLAVVYGIVPPSMERSFAVEQGDLQALIKAQQLLSQLYEPDRFHYQDGRSILQNLDHERNIFCLSGPRWNPVTAHFLGQLGSPARFVGTPAQIAVQTPEMNAPNSFETTRQPGQLATVCHGLILSGVHVMPNGAKQHVLMCAGRSTLSTSACISFLQQISRTPALVKDLHKRGIRGDKKWGLIIRVERAAPEALMEPFHEIDMDIKIVRYFAETDFAQPYRFQYA